MSEPTHTPKVTIIQPALPSYRIDLFDRLAAEFGDRFTVYASAANMGVLTRRSVVPAWYRPLGQIRQAFGRLQWQVGALRVPVRAGDVVVISGAPRCLSNLVLLAKAKLAGARTIWWGHYWSATSREWRQALRLWMMQASDGYLFYTDAEVQAYIQSLGRPPLGRVSALNNGINTLPIERYRAPYAPSRRARSVFFVGRLEPKARLELLLQALALPELAGVTLEVVGGGSKEEELKRLAQDIGLAGRVQWHGGSTDEERIAAVANRCRLFVYPGEVGLSLVHGMAYGLPAVVHADWRTHMPEIAAHTDGVTGRSFRPGDAADLAATIGRLINDDTALEGYSRAALEVVQSGFNTADMARRFIRFVEQMGRRP